MAQSMFFATDSWPTMVFRLSFAALVGLVIGLNRERRGRSAGMRTFMLVSTGAAMFVMIPLQADGDSSFAAANALSRTIQGVATGVGFLGAGLILQPQSKQSNTVKVRGLTTAASVWMAAALGAAIGCGLWQMCLFGSVLSLLTLSGVKRVRRSLPRSILRRHSRSEQQPPPPNLQ